MVKVPKSFHQSNRMHAVLLCRVRPAGLQTPDAEKGRKAEGRHDRIASGGRAPLFVLRRGLRRPKGSGSGEVACWHVGVGPAGAWPSSGGGGAAAAVNVTCRFRRRPQLALPASLLSRWLGRV